MRNPVRRNQILRYGHGNVHFVPSEEENAKKNIAEILKNHHFENYRAVLLNTKYGKSICIIDDSFFADHATTDHFQNPIIIDADGLFTTRHDTALLSKSADAHSIIFESSKATAILVGSWRCLTKEIFGHMMEYFITEKINPSEITLRIGPGLGKDAYDVPESTRDILLHEYEGCGIENAFLKKTKKSPQKPQKYIINFTQLITSISAFYGIEKIDSSQSENTFDRTDWHKIRSQNTESINVDQLKKYYSEKKYFSARLSSHIFKRIRAERARENNFIPGELQEGADTYDGTGRCLNGTAI